MWGKQKRYPALESYLGEGKVELTKSELVMSWAMGAGISLPIVVAAAFLRNWTTRQFMHVEIRPIIIAVGIPTFFFCLWKAIKESKSRPAPIHQVSVTTRRHLRDARDAGRLEYAVPGSIGLVLEECALAFKRIDDALKSHLWSDSGLPDHWVSVRENAILASQAAMDEVMAMTAPHLKNPWESRPIRSLSELIQRVTGTDDLPLEALPHSFTPTLQVADKMRTLALEVESASAQIIDGDGLRDNLRATSRIDSVLGEIRGLQEAEDELHH